ncbi:Uncharacterized protein conserved in bacteria [Staphylococcus aureus]|uniref:Uncharacterized protein conserved in bacteria n=1 Tax=Staphylococcus aureus TaxID=1280 RepID=A0A380DQX3_STAAU|nr:Uncharacterized protein conserved in bacteria [Staphylococcus aureus]
MNYNILEVKEMPFTMKGYPEKWKEFEVIKRQKAIEIANAMLKKDILKKMLFLLRRKKRKIGIERYRKKKSKH